MIEIKHAGIYVNDIDAETQFYKNVFDMFAICEKVNDSNELLDELLDYQGAKIQVTKLITPKGKETGYGDMIELVKVSEGNNPQSVIGNIYNIGMAHVCFGVDSIEEIKSKIVKNGGCMKTDIITHANGKKYAFANDIEGNWIEIIE